MIWKLSRDGLSASRILDNGSFESRLVLYIPPEDTILPADPLTSAELRAEIQNQIALLEQQQILPRVTREGLLLTIETFAAMQGVTPAQLYLTNIGYRKTKDFDNTIIALRSKMEAIV